MVLKIIKFAPFAFGEVFCDDISSNVLFCLFTNVVLAFTVYLPPIAALFMLRTWSSGFPSALYLLLRRP